LSGSRFDHFDERLPDIHLIFSLWAKWLSRQTALFSNSLSIGVEKVTAKAQTPLAKARSLRQMNGLASALVAAARV